jgi:hypothetical protein
MVGSTLQQSPGFSELDSTERDICVLSAGVFEENTVTGLVYNTPHVW